jgi:hypothetical protein
MPIILAGPFPPNRKSDYATLKGRLGAVWHDIAVLGREYPEHTAEIERLRGKHTSAQGEAAKTEGIAAARKLVALYSEQDLAHNKEEALKRLSK